MNQKKVIIIGAGIGGLATAIKLAQQGLAVTIFEKNSHPGGRCQRIIKQGFTFDTGPTMYLFPHIYADFFTSIGEDINKYITLIRADPTYRLNFTDNTSLTLTSDLRSMRAQLEALEPGSYQAYINYLENAGHHYGIAMKNIVKKSLSRPWEYFNLKNLYLFLKHRMLDNHYAYTQRYFKHPHLAAAFTFQDSYLSLNPFRAPAIYSLFSFSEYFEGSYLPKGGMYQVIRALVQIARKQGVKIVCNSPVRKIETHDHRAIDVTLSNNSVETADYFVVNADMSYAYAHLLPPDPSSRNLLSKKFSSSAIVFHWGLDKVYPQLKTHNLFFSEPYLDGFDLVLNRPEPPAQAHFYVQSPTRIDPSRAPRNCDCLSVTVPINHLYPAHPVDWQQYRDRIRKIIIKRLEQAGLKDIKKHIKFEIDVTPPDWQSHLNLTYGAIYGLDHGISQLGYLRPKREHHKYKNLFFVGADTHPGSGLPTVLLSSQFTSQKIIDLINK
jgi:phytoene desaturase